mgnify:CR=1 FL=1|jgi:hypothetical protein|tara:strand:+ start:2487 stop:2855 length:369 start_codon:yes stop_codon:yes gene_type:complete
MQKFKSDPYKTNLTICIGLIIIYSFSENSLFITVALIVGSLGLISEKINFMIEKCWFLLAKILGYIVPNIILALIFYLILTPISIIYLLFNKDGQIQSKTTTSSQFTSVNKGFNPSSFENPW